jgi:hypothetical protein
MHVLLTLLILAFLLPSQPLAAQVARVICTGDGLRTLPDQRHHGHAAQDCVKCHVAVADPPDAPPVTRAARFAPVAAPDLSVAVHGPPAPAPGPARGPPPSA